MKNNYIRDDVLSAAIVREFLDRLDAPERRIAKYKWLNPGSTNKQAAIDLNIPPRTFSRLFSKIKQKTWRIFGS